MPLAIKCYNDEGHRPEIIDSNARPTALGYRSNGGFYKDAGAMPLAIKCYGPWLSFEWWFLQRCRGDAPGNKML